MYHFYLSYRVPFSETDAMGIVHHSNHARYFERGRVELLRQVGFDYSKVMAAGMHFPLTEMQVQFKKPLRFDDVLWIETTISELTKVRLNFSYRILIGKELRESFVEATPLAEKALVTGTTFHCCVNNAGRPREMDGPMLELFERHLSPEAKL